MRPLEAGKAATVRSVTLVTSYDERTDMADLQEKLDELKQSLLEYDVALDVHLNSKMHDREVRLDNGWTIKAAAWTLTKSLKAGSPSARPTSACGAA